MKPTQVVIIGGGFSGLGVAIQLLERGIKDFVILEKASQLGGTWRENTYPGCACDVPSHLYSYSFAPKTSWSRVFAEAAEIQAYLLEVAVSYGVMPHVQLETEMLRSDWDAAKKRWQIQTNKGLIEAQFIVMGQGPLHEPKLPDVPGLETFKGTTFHSAKWNHKHDLTGKRVAVIGTGSSAIQFVPKIQPKVAHLTVFQRTAPWVLPKPDHVIPPIEKWALEKVPGFRKALRGTIYGATELLQLAQRRPATMLQLQKLAVSYLNSKVKDPELLAAVTPSFTLGCKRLLLSNTYYDAIQAPNATLRPYGVTRVTPTGVVDSEGVEHEVDTIIFGTGFNVTGTSTPKAVYGADGRSMGEVWDGSPTAYLGTTCTGFPNAFFMIGPNTGNGHGSAFVIIEAQANYIVDAVVTAKREHIASIEVTPSAQAAWNAEVQGALATGVFNAGGCASYYLDKNGRNFAIYPWTTFDLRWRMRRFDLAPFAISKETRPTAVKPPRRRIPVVDAWLS
jgi:cation diffusion facilitator CzcD-associated flavoprotein CzcO